MQCRSIALVVVGVVGLSATQALGSECADISKLDAYQKGHLERMQHNRALVEDVEKRLSASEWHFNHEENPHPRAQKHNSRVNELERYVDQTLNESRERLRKVIDRYNTAIRDTDAELKELPTIMKQLKCR
jgi:hypothetical protein